MGSNLQPVDHAIRERFAHEIDRNFSLVCPAGSGKTHSLTERVAAYAAHPDAERLLPTLLVVTFTKKAAEEMQSRARESLLGKRTSLAVQKAFSRVFFGTIHSLAVKLLQTHGHVLGVPAGFDVVEDTTSLLYDYLRDSSWKSHAAQNPLWARALRHIPLSDVLRMACNWDASRSVPLVAETIPSFDFGTIYSFPEPKRADTAANIRAFKDAVREFEASLNADGDGFVAIPEPETGGKDFIAVATEALRPVAAWLQAAAVTLAGELYFSFREWRIRQGLLSYDDQVALAAELVSHPEGARAIRRCGYRVLLDEAQDTDPQQFDLLLNAVLPTEARGGWRDGAVVPPGRFSMVGDLQQSIYGSRADLATYRAVHKYLTQPGVGEPLVYSVTFRCDQAILDCANELFPSVLDGQREQVDYVKLAPRPGVGAGQVLAIKPAGGEGEDPVIVEARCIADFVARHRPEGLRARNWGQIAVLAPRKSWLRPIRSALLLKGIRSVVLSQSDANHDNPAYLWLTAICTVVSDPRNAYEIVGVLRDIYGISDRELGFFAKGDGSVFSIAELSTRQGVVADALNELCELAKTVGNQPLRKAVAHIDEHILRARLRALPVDVYGDLDGTMQTLLATASSMENEGADIRSFAEKLRDEMSIEPDVAREDPECVTILTNYKSKGLQYDCVILPFLGREFSFNTQQYPRMVGARYTPAQFVFDKAGAAEFNQGEDLAAYNEIQRLLYVSVTRAKQTLVLVDDVALWGEASRYSLAGAMGAENYQRLASMPSAPSLPAIKVSKSALAHAGTHLDIDGARDLAWQFSQKISPHRALGDHEGPDARADNHLASSSATLPVLYGIWWHSSMKAIDWALPRDQWTSAFMAQIISCPMPERAAHEWELFLRSDLAATIEAHQSHILVEVPFLVQNADGNAIEGVIDLAINQGTRWLVVDWKTATAPIETVKAQYGPQVDLYCSAVEALTGMRADWWLYSTSLGQSVAA